LIPGITDTLSEVNSLMKSLTYDLDIETYNGTCNIILDLVPGYYDYGGTYQSAYENTSFTIIQNLHDAGISKPSYEYMSGSTWSQKVNIAHALIKDSLEATFIFIDPTWGNVAPIIDASDTSSLDGIYFKDWPEYIQDDAVDKEASKILWAHLQFLYFLDVSLHI